MNDGPVLAPDAAMVLGIASTAIPFARTPEDQAERWLRLLRLHGETGVALQALGVSEVPLPEVEGAHHEDPTASALPEGSDGDVVARVTEHVVRIARERGASGVDTTDVLIAVMEVYGDEFDRVLRAHGTDRVEVLERLNAQTPASA
jgi:hypothetical protein